MANPETLWTKDVAPGLQIIVKYVEQPGGASPVKQIWFYAGTIKGEVAIQAADVQALMAMSR